MSVLLRERASARAASAAGVGGERNKWKKKLTQVDDSRHLFRGVMVVIMVVAGVCRCAGDRKGEHEQVQLTTDPHFERRGGVFRARSRRGQVGRKETLSR